MDQYNERIILLERQEKAHKRLLTGLSHDLRTARAVVADFIPVLEKSGMDYRVIIPEGEILCRLDAQAYTRLLGNLLQNAQRRW